jgi:hypothetical protein
MLILLSTIIYYFYLLDDLALAITSIIQSDANQVPMVTSIPKPNSVFSARIVKYGPTKTIRIMSGMSNPTILIFSLGFMLLPAC